MNNSPFFYEPISGKSSGTLNYSCWDESDTLFRQKEYKQSFYKLLDYLDKDIRKGGEPEQLTVPHGSAIINIQLTDTQIQVKARVLKLDENTKRIPLMRALCEINFDRLELAHATIENDEVIFYYNFDYELASPRKVYDVLWDICRYADKYDDEFSEKFNANSIEEPLIEQYPQEQKDKYWDYLQKEIQDSLDLFEYFDNLNNMPEKYFTISSSIKRIQFFLNPQGYTKTRLEEIISQVGDSDMDLEQRILKGIEFLKDLQNSDKKRLFEDLYQVKMLTPEKYVVGLGNIRETYESSFNRVREAASNNDYKFATMDIVNTIYSMFAFNTLSPSMATPLIDALRGASGKPWKESYEILMDAFQLLMEENYQYKGLGKNGAGKAAEGDMKKNNFGLIINIIKYAAIAYIIYRVYLAYA